MHFPARLSIVSLLAPAAHVEFGVLREASRLSDSALSKQLTSLQYAGHIEALSRSFADVLQVAAVEQVSRGDGVQQRPGQLVDGPCTARHGTLAGGRPSCDKRRRSGVNPVNTRFPQFRGVYRWCVLTKEY